MFALLLLLQSSLETIHFITEHSQQAHQENEQQESQDHELSSSCDLCHKLVSHTFFTVPEPLIYWSGTEVFTLNERESFNTFHSHPLQNTSRGPPAFFLF